jgi:tRNA U38,U39,U40 pseudouridine synthase TruA
MTPLSPIHPVKGILRRADGFVRYAVAIQYHGSSFLGFPYLGPNHEDCILPDGTDLRGYRSVEGRIRQALTDLLGSNGGEAKDMGSASSSSSSSSSSFSMFENIQVSSRTDRGVHALKNTFHVDILQNDKSPEKDSKWMQAKLRQGMNFYLSRQGTSWDRPGQHENGEEKEKASFTTPGWKKKRVRHQKRYQPQQFSSSFTLRGNQEWTRQSKSHELRILNVVPAPDFMLNKYYQEYAGQTPTVDWNARFSATQRTYVYRLLSFASEHTINDDQYDHYPEFGMPFEWDRSWRVMRSTNHQLLNVSAMQEAARYLVGTHDFSSFRGTHCQRSSPIVTMQNIVVQAQPYGEFSSLWEHPTTGVRGGGGLLGLGGSTPSPDTTVTRTTARTKALLVTIQVTGDSFLYRQVRNMVGCLVEVGRGKLRPHHVQDILQAKDRSIAPPTAPAHGLFLVNVQHGDFQF